MQTAYYTKRTDNGPECKSIHSDAVTQKDSPVADYKLQSVSLHNVVNVTLKTQTIKRDDGSKFKMVEFTFHYIDGTKTTVDAFINDKAA